MNDKSNQARLESLFISAKHLCAELDLQPVLERALRLGAAYAGADAGTLAVLDQHRTPTRAVRLSAGALTPVPPAELEQMFKRGLAGRVARERKAVLVADTTQDAGWKRRQVGAPEHASAQSVVCLPLLIGKEVLGVLTLEHASPGGFNEQHLAGLQPIADLAAVAVRNASQVGTLEEAARCYAQVFDKSPDPIIITDREGKILHANQSSSALSGYPPATLLTLSIFDLQSGPPGFLDQTIRQGESIPLATFDAELHTSDRRKIPVCVTIINHLLGGEQRLQWILRDVRERNQLDALRRDLTAMVYHDLRSPLANIIISLDVLKAMLPPETAAQVGPVLGITERSIARMQRLVNSLLDIDRLEANQPVTALCDANVETLVHQAVDAVRSALEGKEQRVEVRIASRLPLVRVDADMIQRVLINLLENAEKYSPVKGLIEVEACAQGKWVQVRVKDSGPGIPPEWREEVFEKYTRIQAEHFPGGLGLGLAFCRLAVEAHGGRIWIEGRPNEGSQFIFTLPISQPEKSG